jgi:predicted dehydrogenase
MKKGWMYPTWNEVEAYGFPNELGHFVSCIQEGKQPRETFEDGLLVNKIVEAAYNSANSRRWENV